MAPLLSVSASISTIFASRNDFVEICTDRLSTNVMNEVQDNLNNIVPSLMKFFDDYDVIPSDDYDDGDDFLDLLPQNILYTVGSAMCDKYSQSPSSENDSEVLCRRMEEEGLILNSGPEEDKSLSSMCRSMAPVLERIGLLIYSERMLEEVEEGEYEENVGSTSCPCISLEMSMNESFPLMSYPNNYSGEFGGVCWTWNLLDQCWDPMPESEIDAMRRCDANADESLKPKYDTCCQKWCFVDKDNCDLPYDSLNQTEYDLEDIYREALPNFDVLQKIAYLSFETCGNINSYQPGKIRKNILGLELRTGYPERSSNGYTLVVQEDALNGAKLYYGSIPHFEEKVRADNKYTINETAISRKSMLMYPDSSYTQCVHDVALGELDICFGAFWMTTERLLMSSFTNSIYDDSFFLIVFKGEDESLLDMLATPFKPFTVGAWFSILGAFLYMAFVVALIQESSRTKDEMNASDDKENTQSTFSGMLGNALYNGLNSFTRGEVSNASENPSLAERVVIVGFVIFTLIVLTAYTATSAAFMVETSKSSQYGSIDDVLDDNKKICINVSVQNQFGDLRPQSTSLLVGKSSTQMIFEEMDSEEEDTCVAAILDKDGFKKALVDDENHCDKAIVGDVLMMVGNAFPVNPDYREDLAYVIEETVNKGEYEKSAREMQDAFVGTPTCMDSMEGSLNEDSEPTLTFPQLLSPFVITFICTSAGLALVFPKIIESRKKDREVLNSYSKIDDDVDILEEYESTRIEFDSLRGAPLSDLLKILNELEISNDGVDKIEERQALNSLPDLTKLWTLIYFKTCSDDEKTRHYLEKMEISFLLDIARSSNLFSIDDMPLLTTDLNDDEDVELRRSEFKRTLIDFIMKYRDCKHLACRSINSLGLRYGVDADSKCSDVREATRDMLERQLASRRTLRVQASTLVKQQNDSSCPDWSSSGTHPISDVSTNLQNDVLYFRCSDNSRFITFLREGYSNASDLLLFGSGKLTPISKSQIDPLSVVCVQLCIDSDDVTITKILQGFFDSHDPKYDESSSIFARDKRMSKVVRKFIKSLEKKFENQKLLYEMPSPDYIFGIKTKVYKAGKYLSD